MEDKHLNKLQKAVGAKVPKLTDETIIAGIAKPRASVRKNLWLGLSGVAVAATAIFAVMPSSPTPLINLAQSQPQREGLTSSSDAKMAVWVTYEYVAGAGLATNTGNGSVYQLKLKGTPEGIISTLATRFEIEGTASKDTWDEGKTYNYFFGTKDNYEKPNLNLYWGGTGNWYYSRSVDYNEKLNLPSKADASAQAVELFNQTGLTVSAKDVAVTSGDWGMSATASLQVNGEDTALEWTMSWAPNGEVAGASGHSVELINKGTFGTISERDSVGRLGDWRYGGAAASSFYGVSNGVVFDPITTDVTSTKGGAVEPVTGDAGATDSNPGGEATEEPTVEPTPDATPQKVVMTLVSAKNAHLLIWDDNGVAWLVPGYLLKNSDGWYNSVISLVDGVIALPKLESGVTPMVK